MSSTPQLPTRTVAWLSGNPPARGLVESVWGTLIEWERAGQNRRLLAAVRFVLIHHEPTGRGRCRACRRVGWRGRWRHQRFPCVVWQQIHCELLGPLAVGGGAGLR